MADKVLDCFFHPKSIAVFGASENIYSYGQRYIQALLDYGYKGRIYLETTIVDEALVENIRAQFLHNKYEQLAHYIFVLFFECKT